MLSGAVEGGSAQPGHNLSNGEILFNKTVPYGFIPSVPGGSTVESAAGTVL